MMKILALLLSLLLPAQAFAQAAGTTKVPDQLITGTISSTHGGLGAAFNAATANQIPVFNGSTPSVAAPTTFGGVGGFFDTICSSIVGQFWVRLSSGWGCTSLGYKNPVWYGADPTGTSDSASAINTALTGGGVIRFPAGTFKLTSAAMSFPANTPTWLYAYGATVNSGSNDCVDVINTQRTPQGGIFGLTCSGTGTNGAKITYASYGFTVQDFYVTGYTYGLQYTNAWTTYGNRITCIGPNGACIYMAPSSDGAAATGGQGGNVFDTVTAYCYLGPTTGVFSYCAPRTGSSGMGNTILLKSDTGSHWKSIQGWGGTGPGFFAYPPSSGCVSGGACGVTYEFLENVEMDTSVNASGGCTSDPTTCGDGLRFDTTGGGTVKGIFCTQCWASYNQNAGFVVSGNSAVYAYDVRAVGSQFFLNSNACILPITSQS